MIAHRERAARAELRYHRSMIRSRHHLNAQGALVAVLSILMAAVLLAPRAAQAEEEGPLHLPSFRLGLGANVHPGQDDLAGFALDLALGARISLNPQRIAYGLAPEIGYAYSSGEEVGSHALSLGLGFWFGSSFRSLNLFAAFLAGRRAEELDLGLRAGLRGEIVLGTIGLEVAYELRGGDAETLHSIHLALSVDFGPLIFFLSTFSRR
jgi:hypothetical protein